MRVGSIFGRAKAWNDQLQPLAVRPPPATRASAPAVTKPTMSSDRPLSAVMIVYNEAEALEVTLQQLKRAVDQVVIIDMGSTDDSADLYASHLDAHDEVALYPRDNLFRFGFAHARNYGAALSRHDLIFAIDADEWIDPSELTLARKMWFQPDQPHFHLVSRRNYEKLPNTSLADVDRIVAEAPFTEESHCRIYQRRRQLLWEGLLHEELINAGEPTAQRCPLLPVTLHHLNQYKPAGSVGEKPLLYAYLLLRAVKYPAFRAGMNGFYFDQFVPQHLDEFIEHANVFAASHGQPTFAKSEIEALLPGRHAAQIGSSSA